MQTDSGKLTHSYMRLTFFLLLYELCGNKFSFLCCHCDTLAVVLIIIKALAHVLLWFRAGDRTETCWVLFQVQEKSEPENSEWTEVRATPPKSTHCVFAFHDMVLILLHPGKLDSSSVMCSIEQAGHLLRLCRWSNYLSYISFNLTCA